MASYQKNDFQIHLIVKTRVQSRPDSSYKVLDNHNVGSQRVEEEVCESKREHS